MVGSLAPFAGPDEPDPAACAAAPASDEPEAWELELEEFEPFEALEEFEALDGALPCAAGGWLAGAVLPPPEPLVDVCRMEEKLCDGAFVEVELAGGAELGAVIISRIASVMNRAACALSVAVHGDISKAEASRAVRHNNL